MTDPTNFFRKEKPKSSKKKSTKPSKATEKEYKIGRLGNNAYEIVYPSTTYIISLRKDGLHLKIIKEGLRIETFDLPKKKGQKFADERIFSPIELQNLLIERGVDKIAIEKVFELLKIEKSPIEPKSSTYREAEMIAIMQRMGAKYGRPLKNIPSFEKIPSLLLTEEIRISIGQKQVSGKDGYRFVDNFSIRNGNHIVKEGIKLKNLETDLIYYIDNMIEEIREKTVI